MFHSPRFIGLRKDKNTGTGGGGAAAMAKLKATLSAGSTTNAGWQKVPFTTTVLDTDTIWDNTNKRVVPKIAGYYLVSARARGAAAVQAAMRIYKNGAVEEAVGEDTGSTILYATGGTGYVYCNGTTDYLEIWVFANAVAAYTVAADETYFQVIGPLAVPGGTAGTTEGPSFRAYLAAAQAVPSGVATRINFDTENYDTNNAFSANVFTVPAGFAGIYHFDAALSDNGAGSSMGGGSSFHLYVNGVSVAKGVQPFSTSNLYLITLSADELLAEGDVVDIRLVSTNAITTATGTNNVRFSGHFVRSL